MSAHARMLHITTLVNADCGKLMHEVEVFSSVMMCVTNSTKPTESKGKSLAKTA